MAELDDLYQTELAEKDLPPEVQTSDMRKVWFRDLRTQKEMAAAASKNNKFVLFSDAEAEEMEIEGKQAILNETGRKAVNVGAYLLSGLSYWLDDKGSQLTQEEITKTALGALGIPDRKEDDPVVGQVMGAMIDMRGQIYGGQVGINLLKKFHSLKQASAFFKTSTTFGQQALAVAAGETAMLNMTNPGAEAAYKELRDMFEFDSTTATYVADSAVYFFSHDMDDGKIEKFLKGMTADALLIKNFDQIFQGIKFVIRRMRELKAAKEGMQETVPHIKRLVDQGDIGDEAAAKKLLEVLETDLPTTPLAKEVFDNITEEMIRRRTDGQFLQLAAGQKYVEGSAFVNEDGMPMLLSHVGNTNGRLSTYAQASEGKVDVSKSEAFTMMGDDGIAVPFEAMKDIEFSNKADWIAHMEKRGLEIHRLIDYDAANDATPADLIAVAPGTKPPTKETSLEGFTVSDNGEMGWRLDITKKYKDADTKILIKRVSDYVNQESLSSGFPGVFEPDDLIATVKSSTPVDFSKKEMIIGYFKRPVSEDGTPIPEDQKGFIVLPGGTADEMAAMGDDIIPLDAEFDNELEWRAEVKKDKNLVIKKAAEGNLIAVNADNDTVGSWNPNKNHGELSIPMSGDEIFGSLPDEEFSLDSDTKGLWLDGDSFGWSMTPVGDKTPTSFGTNGMHFTKVASDVRRFEKKTGRNNLVWAGVPENEILRLDDEAFFQLDQGNLAFPTSDELVNDIEELALYLAIHDAFDPNEIHQIMKAGTALTDAQIREIIFAEGLNPEGYDLKAARNNYSFIRMIESGGYKAVTYWNDIQAGQSVIFIDPANSTTSIYDRTTAPQKALSMPDPDSSLGVVQLSPSETEFAQTLIDVTKAQELEFGLQFIPRISDNGIDFNFDRINTGEDVLATINAISGEYSNVISTATRDKITHKMTQQLAEELDWDVKKIIERQEGGTFNAEQMLASRHILLASANKLDKMSGKINLGQASDDQKLAFQRQMQMHALVQAQVKGAQTEIARALSAMRIVADLDHLSTQRLLDIIDIEDMATQYAKTATNRQKNKFAKVAEHGPWKTFMYVYTNSLLANPITQIRNITGNTAFQLYMIPESLLTQTIATGRRALTGATDGARFSDNIAALQALPQGFKQGFIAGQKAWSTGRASDKFTKIGFAINNHFSSTAFGMDESSLWARGVDLAGFAIGLPGRALLTNDEFNKGFVYFVHQQIQANQRLAKGIADGDDAEVLSNRFFNDVNGFSSEVNAAAADMSHDMTFTSDLDGMLGQFQLMRHKFPIVQVHVPFYRAPVNIIGSALSRTPTALLSSQVRSDLMSGGPKADKAMAKIVLGTMITWTVYEMAIEGKITGGGSGNFALDKHLKSVGRQPYSFVFKTNEISPESIAKLKKLGVPVNVVDDEVFISYRSFEPVSTIIAMSADLADFMKYYNQAGDESSIEVATKAIAHSIRSLSNTTFLNNIYDVVRASQEPDGFLIDYVGNMMASAIPGGGLVRAIEKHGDPELRVADMPRQPTATEEAFYKTMRKIQQSIPGWSEDLPLGLNVWGDVRRYSEGHWTEMFNPAHIMKGKRQAIDFEIERLGNVIQMPSNQVQGIILGNREYNNLLLIMNDIEISDIDTGITGNFRESLNQLVELPEYKLLTRDDQITMLDRIKNSFLRAARAILIDEDDSLYEDILELKQREADERLDAQQGISP